eukprot:Amastigsp_a387_3.p3 type:complete len:115 gc:universal Amastigsp_a387_3:333-677(+)
MERSDRAKAFVSTESPTSTRIRGDRALPCEVEATAICPFSKLAPQSRSSASATGARRGLPSKRLLVDIPWSLVSPIVTPRASRAPRNASIAAMNSIASGSRGAKRCCSESSVPT